MSTLSDQGISGNSEKIPHNKETVEKFARNMAHEIVQSLQVEISDFGDYKKSQAKERAAHVIETSLREAREAYSGENTALQEQQSRKDDNGLRNQPYPALSQSGLPIMGSLDYPDAPPSTPLLPELEKSRQSFSRKLKGGLAKEFAPSPPPPTPKENQQDGQFETKVELIEHLMHSLSTEQSGEDGARQHGKIVEFAEVVSCDIMNCVHKEVQERCNVEMLAEQMAQAIVKCSLEEARNV